MHVDLLIRCDSVRKVLINMMSRVADIISIGQQKYNEKKKKTFQSI